MKGTRLECVRFPSHHSNAIQGDANSWGNLVIKECSNSSITNKSSSGSLRPNGQEQSVEIQLS
jgi:hypothetical protein